MFNLFRKRNLPIVVLPRDPTQVTLEEWRSNPSLTKQALVFLQDPNFRMLLDVLRTSHFVNYSLPNGASIEDRAVMQARGEGYTACLNNIEALGKLSQDEAPIEETFEPPETGTTEEIT